MRYPGNNPMLDGGQISSYLLVTICMLLICGYYNKLPADTLTVDNTKQEYAINNEVDAFQCAMIYLGFDILTGFSNANLKEVKIGPNETCETPFVADYVKQNNVWTLYFVDVPLVGHFGKVKRDFEVIMEPVTGRLLSVYSLSQEYGSSDTLPEPNAALTEETLTNTLKSIELPEKPPKTSLIEAFRICTKIPEKAKLIRAFYIDYYIDSLEHKNSWIIILRGTDSPMHAHGPGASGVPVNERNCVLYLIDAKFGRLNYFGTAPQNVDLIRRRKGIK